MEIETMDMRCFLYIKIRSLRVAKKQREKDTRELSIEERILELAEEGDTAKLLLNLEDNLESEETRELEPDDPFDFEIEDIYFAALEIKYRGFRYGDKKEAIQS
ncbi:hypothetical protein GcM3_183002 [Golovinomyces cichoracearum]|uniref:Uncharacterized protein n=1 Tax=Golovinomyces cichoracearum TaxID=62708 RepID=A0A420HL24_9PEZI|nr:hypothetical protein GcM3_183002 [Golovinomyces cichoracearum]